MNVAAEPRGQHVLSASSTLEGVMIRGERDPANMAQRPSTSPLERGNRAREKVIAPRGTIHG